ncbi:MAG: penicillin-binding protein 2, partial [Deltaproteobacteria bacterium]
MGGRNRFSARLAVVGLCCALCAGAIIARMTYLVLVEGPELGDQVRDITCRETVKMSYRGPILDRNGTALATSVAASRVALRRSEYRFDPRHVGWLAPLLGVEPSKLAATLRDDPRRFVWLSKSVGVEAANAIRRLHIPGIDVHRSQQRAYPQGPLAAHVIGFVGVDAQGLEGLELLYDDRIRGEPVSVRVCKDGRGRVFLNESDEAGINQGASVHLTIDATLQSIAESELSRQVHETRALGGSAVLMNPRTGEVLAMANVPTFDPNAYGRYPLASRRNRAITDTFEPGSTTKPLLVAGALDAGRVRESDTFFCENGEMRIGGWPIHDHHPYETLSVPEIIRVSSNICAAKIGERVGAKLFHDYLSAFGFGRRSGVGLPGDRAGVLPPADSWRPINLANISFGQGLTINAMQLASAFATLANDGVRMRPYIVDRIVGNDGSLLLANGPRPDRRVVGADSARRVTRMLEDVVGAEGTAPLARVPGIRVAGKTGTAQKVENGRYSHTRWVASFVG